MLSYRHSFHAGNFADVIKHIVLIEILQYLIKKDSPFDYIDTHAGAGLYDLRSEYTTKLQEFTKGIGKLKSEDWPELTRYFNILQKYNSSGELTYYPGSPVIAQDFLRIKDRAWLFEMHPADCKLLALNLSDDKRIKIMPEDGYKGLLALLPPVSRRGLILIDPPYEVKSDYDQVVDTILKAYKKFSTGTYAIWYPVVERKRIERLENRFKKSGIKKIQRFELAIAENNRGKGMTAAGMIVINPPYILIDSMSKILPKLAMMLGKESGASYKCEEWVGE